MLKKILIAFATLMGLVLAVGLALPSKYRVERTTTIQAPPEAVYAYVANLERWQDWGPWNARKYPGNQWMFGGPEVGVGAVHSWSGADVGNGTLSLTQADPRTGVAYDMSVEHGRYLLHGRISFEPEGQGTRVTWVDEGDIGGNPLAHYLVPLIRSRLGGYFEEGLAQLKKLVEANSLPAGTKPEPAPTPVEQATAPAQPPAPEQPAPPPAEGSQAAAPPEGTQVVASPVEGSQAPAPAEAAPTAAATTPSEGEQAPAASPGTAAPSGAPTPVETAPVAPAPTPAPAAGDAASPT
ncbi:SRPBCC family protein [Archangium sp.]|uniref:SRPBCC family protein n=1 Tax=Archangium sp. TaxID=1872627 RepID=UPI002D305C9C|nr:SRPBCC family protein [Archangium sp.]HYO53473.1 SRPBCC family protein [Archangium sp.]